MNIKKNISIKNECLFVSLASYAHDIIKQNDVVAFNGEGMEIAKAINGYFNKNNVKRYNKNQVERITNYLRDVSGPAFPDKINAAVIMVATLNYLFKEVSHQETKLAFPFLRSKIDVIVKNIEHSESHEELLKAYKTIVNMLDEKESNFKPEDINKEKIRKFHFTVFALFYKVIYNIETNEKNVKVIDKFKSIISNTNLEIMKGNINQDVENSITDTKDINLYTLKSIIDILLSFGNKHIPSDKIKKINFNYLITDKNKLEKEKEKINKILSVL